MRSALIILAVLALGGGLANAGEARLGAVKVAVGPRKARPIKRALAAVRPALATCHEEMSGADVDVWIAIGAEGAAALLAPDGTTPRGACIARAVATLKLPAAAAPAAVRVKVTFVSDAELQAEAFANLLSVDSGPTDSEDMSRRQPGTSLADQIEAVKEAGANVTVGGGAGRGSRSDTAAGGTATGTGTGAGPKVDSGPK